MKSGDAPAMRGRKGVRLRPSEADGDFVQKLHDRRGTIDQHEGGNAAGFDSSFS